MYDMSEENIIQVWREEAKTVLVVFSGIFPVAGSGPFDFLVEAGFTNCSLIYLSDYYRSGYLKGVSENLPTLDHVLDWCQKTLEGRDIEEVSVVGASSGVLPAFLCARGCGAKKAWGFGPRPINTGFFHPMSHKGSPYNRLSKFKISVRAKTAQWLNRPARDWFSPRDLGWDVFNQQLLSLQTSGDGSEVKDGERDYKVYHVPSNVADTKVSTRLAECPGISRCEVQLPGDYEGDWNKQPGWDHSVIQVMRLGSGVSEYM